MNGAGQVINLVADGIKKLTLRYSDMLKANLLSVSSRAVHNPLDQSEPAARKDLELLDFPHYLGT